MFPVCITGCGHIMYSVVPVTGLSQAWWYMNCLWFYATKRPLGTIRKSMDCLPSGFVGYIHRRRYTSVVVDIYRLYICDQRRHKAQPTQPHLSTVSPNISYPLREPLPDSPVSPTCIKNTPCVHYIVRT